MEYVGYALLAIVALIWIVALFIGMIAAFPYGIIGLIALVGVGLLFMKVIRDRLENKEDDHYSDHVEQ
jgi:hypothetical protein